MITISYPLLNFYNLKISFFHYYFNKNIQIIEKNDKIIEFSLKNFIDFYHIGNHNKIRHILEVLL